MYESVAADPAKRERRTVARAGQEIRLVTSAATISQTCSRPGGQFGEQPRQGQENSNRRNVSVTVSHALGADLNETDNRHERAQIPEPADQEVGPRVPPGHSQDRYAQQ